MVIGALSARNCAAQFSGARNVQKGEFSKWFNDKDKICTDGNDNGKISFGEGVKSFAKGIFGVVKSSIKHPILTAASIAASTGLVVATGGAALPVLVAAGITIGAGQIGLGAYKVTTAKTDGEAKRAFETIGSGTFGLAASILGARPALNAAASGGVSVAEGAEKFNVTQAAIKCFKVAPQALKQSTLNIKGNFLSFTHPGELFPNSNRLRAGQVKYMSKANEAQAYRFNPNGSEAEVLQNNPGVFAKDGKYYVSNKWNQDAPFLIDTSKEQMIMLYGGDDMAVCDGKIFKGSYVDSKGFKANGALNYQEPSQLKYGEIIDVTKQAPGAFREVSAGTKIHTLEGVVNAKEGQVVAIDNGGNPYVMSPENILKRNIPLDNDNSRNGFKRLEEIIAAQNAKN